jgi:threonine 3-dehydrogenase
VTPGHEAAGVVVAAGPNTRIAPGTPSVILLMEFCGACRSCKLGLTNQCLDKRGGVGFTKDGGYGVYLLANEQTFFLVDPDIPATNVTMLLDVMGTTAHVIERAKLVHPDIQSLLFTGAGPVGLGMLAMAKIFGKEFPVLI